MEHFYWEPPSLLLEHEATPGKEYNNKLFIETCSFYLNECELHESTTSSKLLTFKGKFQEAEAVNKNMRMYPRAILDENVKRLAEVVNSRGLVGELDHPSDSIVHYKETSHLITKLWWENNTLMGEGEILDTPCGDVLKTLINRGVRVGISSRGVGNGKVNEQGVLVIGESYKLITFDAVADPSTHAAFQQKVVDKNEHQNHDVNSPKNEQSGIHTLSNKNLLVAVLGGLIQ